MSTAFSYPPGIPYRSPRPRGENGSAGWRLSELLTANSNGVLTAGVGNVLAGQPPTLEAAIRSYLTKKGLPVVSFYRLGRRHAKVLFSYADQYWIIESRAAIDPNWTAEKLDDWLYGDLVQALEARLAVID